MKAAGSGPAAPQTFADPQDTVQRCLEYQALWRWVSRASLLNLMLSLHIIIQRTDVERLAADWLGKHGRGK